MSLTLDLGGCGVGEHKACSGQALSDEDELVTCPCCDTDHTEAFGRVTHTGRVRSELPEGERPVTGL